MLTAVGKVWGYMWGADTQDADQGSQQNLADDEEDVASQREFEGTVTHMFDKHGLIDNEVYFSLDHVLGGVRPCVNDVVAVVATQQYLGGGWHAKQVSISDDWDNATDGDDDDDDGSNMAFPVEVMGIVTCCSENTGYINEHIHYDLAHCECDDFVPHKGDWIKAKVSYSGENKSEVVADSIEPVRVKEVEGIISAVMEDHGYIDGEVFYMRDAIEDGYFPGKWEPVYYKAVESQQGKCSWRAVTIKKSQKPNTTSLKVLQGPLRKSFTEELLTDKEGIMISKETDFKTVAVGIKKILTIWVKNNGSSPKVFSRCHMTASSSQLKIKAVKLLKEHGAMMKSGGNEEVKGNVCLYPSMSLYVNIELDARSQGKEKHLVIFTFDNFKIGRYITAVVTDPMLGMFAHDEPYAVGKRQAYSRYRETVEDKSTPWLVPGERPNRKKKTVQYPHRLPHYEVPEELRETVLSYGDLLQYAPALEEELSADNYRERFKHLLHLEEIQMEIDIREFDIHRVCMRHVGEFMGLKVPGLAEGRPSVLLGDKVMLTDPGDPYGPCYEGYVHEIFKDEVLLKFNPDFHRSYTGKDYDAVFTFNRGPLRKCHKASEMAVSLGHNVLFPKFLYPKPSQYSMNMQGASLTPVKCSKSSGKPAAGIGLNFFNQKLNDRQRSAVVRIVQGQGRPLPYILFGPPGTGKTVTVVEAILQTFVKLPSSRIITCTPSNSAADLVATRLHESGLVNKADMVRLNALQRSEEGIPDCIKPYCTVGDNIDLASRYRILVTTCVSAGVLYTLGIKAGHFTHVFIDEAGQATEPESMISSCLVSSTEGQIILAGDPQQLGPVLRSKFAKTYGLDLSLLERLIDTPLYERNERMFADHGAYDPLLVTKLVNNYRSHSSILKLPSRLFYHDELVEKADEGLTHKFCNWQDLPTKDVPVIFHGVRGEDMREGNSPSWFNPMEAVQVVRYLQSILNMEDMTVNVDDIGIITPYRKQVEKIRLLIDKLDMESIKVGSVEEFQGQEKEVIIISTVRSNEELIGFDEKHTLGFLSNPKRFNVAITRAQALLVIIGNPHVLVVDEYWKTLLEYCVKLGAYTGCDLPPTSVAL